MNNLRTNISFFLMILILFLHYETDGETYRIFFKDKGPGEFFIGSELYENTLNSLSSKSLARRAKVLIPDSLINIDDAPIYSQYIDSVEALGGECRLKLKWENYTVVQCDSVTALQISNLSFVLKVRKTSSKLIEDRTEEHYSLMRSISTDEVFTNNIRNIANLNYAESFNQANMLNVPIIHGFGISGAGVLMGFIDTGFKWRKLSALSQSNVLREFDFVANDTLTENDSTDAPAQDNHGTLCFAVVAGYLNNKLIGIAPNADFVLAKTENVKSEKRIEEDNYAAAIEWMEAQGADISSASLGYSNYDSSEKSAVFEDFDGKTTVASRAINNAVKRGMICITSAGNKGPLPKSIVSPADADSVIAVGAVLPDSITVAGFSSRGPNAGGAIKPNVSAMGFAVFTLVPSVDSATFAASGTSLSAPLVAGASALFLSTFPEVRTWEFREILYRNSSLFPNPNNDAGYGVPDIYRAMIDYGIIIGQPGFFTLKSSFVRVFCHIDSKYRQNLHRLFVRFSNTASFTEFKFRADFNRFRFVADIPINLFRGKAAEAYIIADDGMRTRRKPFDEKEYFIIEPEIYFIPFGVSKEIASEISDESSDLFAYPSILTNRDIETVFTLLISAKSDITFSIINSIGQKVDEIRMPSVEPGIIKRTYSTEQLPSGMYFVHATGNELNEFCRFIISR